MVQDITIINAKPDWLSLLAESIRNWWTRITCVAKENYFLIN